MQANVRYFWLAILVMVVDNMTKPFTDDEKITFADAFTGRLELQKIAALELFNASMDDEHGNPKRKALGYIYGWIDAALDHYGHDMSDMEIGVPVLYRVLYNLFPQRAIAYMNVLIDAHKTDPVMRVGIMHGGQQFLDYSRPNHVGGPMGLARFMSEPE